MTQNNVDTSIFAGFEIANATPVPDMLFDELLTELSGSELKVVLYIIRRTCGFKKDADAISYNQFINGIVTKDGRVLDKGCGIKNRTVLSKALLDTERKGYITSKKGVDPHGDKATTLYGLRVKESQGVVTKPYHLAIGGSNQTVPPVVTKPYYGSIETVLGVVSKPYLQDTVIQDTEKQETVIQEDTLGDGSLTANVTPPLAAETDNDSHENEETPEWVSHPQWSFLQFDHVEHPTRMLVTLTAESDMDEIRLQVAQEVRHALLKDHGFVVSIEKTTTSNLPALFESLATAGGHIATDDVPTAEEQDAREQAETLQVLIEADVVQTTSPVSEPAVESVKLTEDAPSMSGECPVDAPQAFEQPMQETLMPEASAPQVALTEEEWLTERALHERKLLSLWKECKTGTRLKAQYATWVICRRAELAIWERSHKKPSKADALWAQLTPAEQEGVRRWHSLSRGAVITREDVEGAQLFTTSGVALTQEQMRDERDWLRENQQGWFGFAGTKRGRVSYRDLAEHAAGWFDALEHPVSALPPQQRGNGNLRIVKTNWDDPNFSIDDDFYPDEATKHARWAAQAAAAAR